MKEAQNIIIQKTLTLNGNQTPQQVNDQIQSFNQLQVPYGTILKIYAGHPQLFSIEGPVRDKSEDIQIKFKIQKTLLILYLKLLKQG